MLTEKALLKHLDGKADGKKVAKVEKKVVVSEEAVLYWAKKGSAHKGRAIFLENAAPFIKWLEEAESEEDDE